MKDEAIRRFLEHGVEDAIEFLRGQEDVAAAMDAFVELQKDVFWQAKDVTAMVAVGRAGMTHGSAAADRLADGDAAYEVRSRVKALAYNVASFTWPGWDDGIEIEPAAQAIGLDAARTNLRLARELDKGALPLSRAHWVLGAQLLAAGRHDEAGGAFEEAIREATAAESLPDRLLCEGYAALTRLLMSPADAGAAASLDRAREGLRPLEHGEFFVGQLDAARRVFS